MSKSSGAACKERALVLTAGLGTRLRPLTYVRAKGAVPVNGEALARRVARWLAANGIRDQIFNLHHHAQSVAASLGDGTDLGVRVRYSWENPVLGSAGGPRHALPLLTDGGMERFLIVNGDTLTDVDLEAMIDAHRRSGAQVTMALIKNPAPEKYGGVLVSDEGYVTGFTRRGTPIESYHFIGVQVVEAGVFGGLEDGVPVESVGKVYPALMNGDPRSVAAFVSDAEFRDIGTPADCLRTSLELAAIEGDRLVAGSSRVDATATVERSALWDDVAVGAGARLVECVVGDGSEIPAGASFERCAIVPAAGREPATGERIEGALLLRSL
jgi:mannose-1-phosphate guanylyltransferase